MHARSRIALAAVAGLFVLSSQPALAQQALAPRTPPADVAALTPAPALPADSSLGAERAGGPTQDAARVGVTQPQSANELSGAAQARRRGLGQPVALMVVGGAAFLAGLIISDEPGTVIAITGAVIGLYGLYQYLQ